MFSNKSSTSLWLMSKNSRLFRVYMVCLSTFTEFLVATILYLRLKRIFADKISTTVSSDREGLNIYI